MACPHWCTWWRCSRIWTQAFAPVFWRSLNPHLFPFQESGISGSWPSWHVYIWLTSSDPRFGCHIVCFQNKDLHYTLGPRPLWHLLNKKRCLIKQFKICNSAQPLFLFCVLDTKRRALPFLKEFQPNLRSPWGVSHSHCFWDCRVIDRTLGPVIKSCTLRSQSGFHWLNRVLWLLFSTPVWVRLGYTPKYWDPSMWIDTFRMSCSILKIFFIS